MNAAIPGIEAIVRTATGAQRLRVPRPALRGEHDVRVLPVRAGLCRTDLHVALGRIACEPPRILGHELSGVVAEVGTRVRRVGVGDRVAVDPLLPCGVCAECAQARACEQPRMLGVAVDGGFAQELLVDERAVYAVPTSLSFERAAYVEPVAATLAVLSSPLQRAERGLIVGTGRIAELTRRVLAARGFERVDVVDAEAARGATSSVAWAIDTLGSSDSMAAALHALRQRGLLVLKSRPAQPAALDVAFAVQRELTLQAVRYAPFDDAIALLCAPGFAVEDLFGATYPLAEFERVFSAAERSESAKVFFAPNPELG